MRRKALICGIVAAAAAGAGGAGSLAAGRDDARGSSRLASVRVDSCDHEAHMAVFHGRMRRVRGATWMWMRFALLEKGLKGRFVPLRAPGLGRWRKSRSGVRRFGFRQRVLGLEEGSIYRVRVSYRWLDDQGQVLLHARRRSRPCDLAGPLPNLRIAELRAYRGPRPGTSMYVVRVENAGLAEAQDVPVALSVDRAVVNRQTISTLQPGEVKTVRFVGPACERSDSRVEAVADPDDAIREADETDNRLAAPCSSIRN